MDATLKQYAGHSHGLLQGATAAVKAPNVFNHAMSTMSNARSLATRVEDLVNRIVGSAPREPSNGTDAPAPSALLDIVACETHETARRLESANEALDRLERQLP